VARGVVFVGDAMGGRIIRFGPRGPAVYASGLVEPTGLTPAPTGGLYAADFAAGIVRRVTTSGHVSALAALPRVTSVVSVGSAVYAVSLDGVLARISNRGGVTRIPVPGGLDRPHGIVVDRDGSLLIGEDSRRVRRVDPASGRASLVVGNVDTNKIAVARDGTLYLAGATVTGGTLRRLVPGGVPSTLISGLHVSDVAVLPGGDVVITTVDPAAVLRVDPRSGTSRAYTP
jgi:streptogramin lyase